MATSETINHAAQLLFAAPLANKPKPDERQNTIRVMALTLRDVDDELLKTAVIQHIATEKWFPAIADLRDKAQSLISRANELPDSYTAWMQVKNFSQDIHPMALKAINALGGLKAFGLSNVSEEASWRARFIAAYEQYCKRQSEDAMMLPAVAGYIEKRKELRGDSVQGLIAEAARKLSDGNVEW